MSVLYNIEIFSALKIAYNGKTDGFPEEDFEKNERERGLHVPEMLKYFLKKYGYMSLNRISDSVRFLHPNIMSERNFNYGKNGRTPLTIVGRVGEYHVSVADKNARDPEVILIKQTPESVEVLPSDDTVSELIKVMLCSVLLKYENTIIADTPQLAVQLLHENGVDYERITNNPCLRREYSLCFTEETRTFTIAEYIDGEVKRFFFVRDEQFISK
ncbi:MAG: hypothetical protein ACI4JS_08900 [Oscillospiraceae bacterium]